MKEKTRWEITGELKPAGWLDYPITNFKILDNGLLRITLYWKDPSAEEEEGLIFHDEWEIPPCDLHRDGTWEEIDSIENDLPQWWRQTNIWAGYEEIKTTWLADTDKIEAWRVYRTNNEPGI